jgi:hypothetical protein
MSGSGDVENCLTSLHDGVDDNVNGTDGDGLFVFTPSLSQAANTFRWAIGFLSADVNTDLSKPYRFIKIDNSAPSAKNVVNGRYRIWAELSQIGVKSGDVFNTAPTANQNALLDDLLLNMRNPEQLGDICKDLAYPFGPGCLLGVANNSGVNAPYLGSTRTGGLTPNPAGFYDITRPANLYTHATAGGTDGATVDHCRVPALPGGNRPMVSFINTY